jgi:BASS family bile acid:Na+ symporter
MFDFYLRHEYWFAAIQLALAMLGMGATLRFRDFLAVFTRPSALLLGIAVQWTVVPFIAWRLIVDLDPVPGVAIGLALCAAIPGGTMSNVFTFLGRGHAALSIAITVVTTLGCLVTTPIVLGLLIDQYMPPDFVMPVARIATEIALILLLPLALGMAVLHLFPGRAAFASRWCIRGSIFVILLIVIGASGADRIDIRAFDSTSLLALALLVGLLATLSWLIPLLLRRPAPECTAINIEVTIRNGNLGLLIKASIFPAVVGIADPVGDMVLLTVLLYGAFALPLGFLQVWLHGRINKRIRAPQREAAIPR